MNHHIASFSHIYVEDQAISFPEASQILEKFSSAVTIPIRHYKDVFNRPRQDWRAQKRSQNLILAVRKTDFLYPGSCLSASFHCHSFYYNSLILNCLYDCDYCYLQGLYPSANVVMFVNSEDYFTATLKALKTSSPLFLCISYDTDLLAFEHILPYCRKWIEFAGANPELTIEIRTKSANYEAVADLAPLPNVLLAWTLSPAHVIEKYEHKTPSLAARLKTINRAVTAGWRVRLCFDPLLLVPDWEILYEDFVHSVFKSIDPKRIEDATLGVFRMNSRFLKNIHKERLEPDILYYPFDLSLKVATYDEPKKQELLRHLHRIIQDYLPPQKIHEIG